MEKTKSFVTEAVEPTQIVEVGSKIVKCYDEFGKNIDHKTIESFGKEWKTFHKFQEAEINQIGDVYFDIVFPEMLGSNKIGADFGCGTGRWTKYIHQRLGAIAAIDPSDAIFSAGKVLKDLDNVYLYKASIDNLPFNDNYFDFGFSLGVLHHIPNTQRAMKTCVKKIKPGGYFLCYLYYDFENRGRLFKFLFKMTNLLRLVISKFPFRLKKVSCDILAVALYMPFIGLSRFLKILGVPYSFRRKIPLQIYEDVSFYVIRNDTLDRFGTPLEQRFSKKEISTMMETSGLGEIAFRLILHSGTR